MCAVAGSSTVSQSLNKISLGGQKAPFPWACLWENLSSNKGSIYVYSIVYYRGLPLGGPAEYSCPNWSRYYILHTTASFGSISFSQQHHHWIHNGGLIIVYSSEKMYWKWFFRLWLTIVLKFLGDFVTSYLLMFSILSSSHRSHHQAEEHKQGGVAKVLVGNFLPLGGQRRTECTASYGWWLQLKGLQMRQPLSEWCWFWMFDLVMMSAIWSKNIHIFIC